MAGLAYNISSMVDSYSNVRVLLYTDSDSCVCELFCNGSSDRIHCSTNIVAMACGPLENSIVTMHSVVFTELGLP
jgi:hypothetical protein